jgi:hypothetical protein
VSNYNIIDSSDYENALYIYKEIKNINITNLDDVSYNFYFTNDFINSNFKVLYRIIEQVQDVNMTIEKQTRFLKFEDIVKIIYHIKRRLIQPLVNQTEVVVSPSVVPTVDERTMELLKNIKANNDSFNSQV